MSEFINPYTMPFSEFQEVLDNVFPDLDVPVETYTEENWKQFAFDLFELNAELEQVRPELYDDWQSWAEQQMALLIS